MSLLPLHNYLILHCRLAFYSSRTILTALYCSKTSESFVNIINSMRKIGAKHKNELRQIKYKQKNNGELPVPAEIYLQVLGNGTRGAPKSVLLYTSSERYLFNCGEATVRLLNEHKRKLTRLENVFFTYKNWNNIGGVPGLAVSTQEVGVPRIIIHGPPGVLKLFKLAEHFAITKVMKEERNYWDPPFSDCALSVEYVPIFGAKNTQTTNLDFEEAAEGQIQENRDSLGSNESSDSNEDVCPPDKKLCLQFTENPRDVAIAYICKTHPKPGHLSLERCLELGVKQGPLLVQLQNGEDITLEDGRRVKSVEVISEQEPGSAFIVVECPTEDFLDSLLSRTDFDSYMTSKEDDKKAELVLHFTPEKVLRNPRYQEWMNRFDKTTSHLVVNDHNTGPCSRGNYRLQAKLNLLHPHIFPLLPDQLKQPSVDFEEIGHPPEIVYGDTLLKYYIRPKQGFFKELCIQLDNDAFIEEIQSIPEVPEKLKELKDNLASLRIYNEGKEYPEILFLGTSSSYPTKERNVSGVLLHTSPDCSILLDCGEGTFFQMIRFYGVDKIDEVLRKLSCVFVSHMHADHQLGLFQILKERRLAFLKVNLQATPLAIVAPPFLRSWMKVFTKYSEEDASNVKLIMNGQFLSERSTEVFTGPHDDLCERLNLKQFLTVLVKHCKHAYGVAITHNSGWKLVYSGDTMPCQNLVEAGKDCDLLIHEATMEDELQFEADRKAHSTTSQAIDIGIQMNARFIILTHFSQRYAKIPRFNEDYSDRVGFAFDNMRVCFSDFEALPLFIPVFKTMFQAENIRLQEVSQRNALQIKLQLQSDNRSKRIDSRSEE